MALCHRNPDWIFVHIFRTGGTSIRRALGGMATFEIGGWHWSLPQVKAHCMQHDLTEFYESAFKFAVVRNPFDWLVSLYHYNMGAKNPVQHLKGNGCAQFIIDYCEQREALNASQPAGANPLITQSEFCGSQWCVDAPGQIDYRTFLDWMKFEELQSEWDSVSPLIDTVAQLDHVNSSNRKANYREYYTEAARRAVEEHFAADLDRFGYAF